jgi:hypothetical protein
MHTSAAKRAQLRVMVAATLSGHDLAPFEPIEPNGQTAHCRRCEFTVWVSEQGLLYSLLPDPCPAPAQSSSSP